MQADRATAWTSQPCSASTAIALLPINPVAPVTNTRIAACRLSRGKIREAGVALGQYRHRNRPSDFKGWIVPTNPTRQGGIIELGHLVEQLGIVCQRLEAVG